MVERFHLQAVIPTAGSGNAPVSPGVFAQQCADENECVNVSMAVQLGWPV